MKAIFSPCGNYRHMLAEGDDAMACAWVMLNPSIAGGVDDWTGATVSDPTARRVANFSRDFGFRSWVIVNLYDKVATDPRDLWTGAPPCSPHADAYLASVAWFPLIILACGKNAERERVLHVAQLLRSLGATLYCLGVNSDGSPKHPLYLPHTSRPSPWVGY